MWRLILPAMILIFCQGCDPQTVVICPVSPVKASPEVKQWLSSKRPWPDPVKAWLIDIGNQQKIIELSCKNPNNAGN